MPLFVLTALRLAPAGLVAAAPSATPTLGGRITGNVQVLGGWVAVRRDGRGAHACVSFKNVAPVTATRVLFEFPILDNAGGALESLTLDRRGTFSPNVDIRGWDTLQSWQQGSNRGYDENCTGANVDVAAFPLMAARLATYRVLRVEYADGTTWAAPTGG